MDMPHQPATPKLRASCDGCYRAKLKCTKERPTCPRCKSLGLVCNYSPSQRAGRTREAKRPPPSPSQWTSSAADSTTVSTDLPPRFFEGTNFQAHSNGSPSLQSDYTMSDRPDTALTDQDTDLLPPWQDYLSPSDQHGPSFNIPDDLLGFYTPSPTPASRDYELALTKVNPPVSDLANPDRDYDPRSCDCFPSILRALQRQSQTPHAPSLETLLSDSKDVLAHGESLLRCACSADSTLILLFTGLLTKHLSFYGAATSPSSRPIVDSPSCSSSRVTIGKYTMDGIDEERVRVEILMMELQKQNALLVRFRGKFSALPVGYEGHTYETVLSFLDTRVREATETLQREKLRLKGAS